MSTTLYDAAIVLRTLLQGVAEVEDRIYPIVATEGTGYPYIVYQRTGVDMMQSKDGMEVESATYDVSIVTGEYSEGLALVDRVIDLLNGNMAFAPGNVSESYVDDSYIQSINCTYFVES